MSTSVNIAGFVLTGGQSSRFGTDKALVPIASKTLCEHIADVVAQVGQQVMLIGHPERYGHLKYQCIADLHPDLGPISGLETALSLNQAPLNLIVGCDIVNIKADWLRALLAEAECGARCAVIEDGEAKIQPLCGVYRSDCLRLASDARSQGKLRMMDLLVRLNARRVHVDEVVLNLNTPEQCREMVNARRGK